MSVLSWGKPTVEFGILGSGGAAPTTWTELPEIVEDTAQLTTEEGETMEAPQEGGELVDSRTKASKYSFALSLFAKKGDTKPIEDANGVVLGNYAIRLTPEDPETPGFIMDKTSVSVQETWNSAEGLRWIYTFRGLKPATGNILKPYPETT